jgi:hypothetical protein
MKQKKWLVALVLVLLIFATFIGTASVMARGNSGYLLRWTVDNGGGILSNGSYKIQNTFGQPDANMPVSNGGYTLTGGFWGKKTNTVTTPNTIFLPVVLRQS